MATLAAGASAGRMGSSFYSNLNPAIGGTQIVAPASNVNGIVVRGCTLLAVAANNLLLVGALVAPASMIDQQTLIGCGGAVLAISPRDIFLPPGKGLYIYSSGANQVVWLGYDIL